MASRITSKTNELSKRIESLENRIFNNVHSGVNYVVQLTIDKPLFHIDKNLNPMRFLKDLKRYIIAINGHNRAIDIALECVAGTALLMLEIYSDNWKSLTDFEKDFQSLFWGRSQQEKARDALIKITWSPNSGQSMSEHFAIQIDSVAFLTIPFSECEIINCIMRHFPIDIQSLWFATTKDPITKCIAMTFLQDIEQNVRMNIIAPSMPDDKHCVEFQKDSNPNKVINNSSNKHRRSMRLRNVLYFKRNKPQNKINTS